MNNQEKTNLYCPIDNIVDPSRIKTLKLCDRKIFTYDPYSFSMVFGFRGRNFGMIAFPLLVLLLWDIGLVFLMDYVPEVHTFLTSKHVVSFEDGGSLEDEIGLGLQDLITSLLTPVSFLMVFRLGRAAARYWDARAAMGKLIETSRTFISTSVVHIQSFQNSPRKQNLREEVSSTSKDISQDPKSTTPSLKKPSSEEDWIIYELARWTCLFPIAVKNFLRPDKNKIYKPKELLLQRRAEIGPLLNRTETKQLLDCLEDGKDKSYATIWILNNLRQLSHKASRLQHKEGTVSTIGSAVYRQLNEQIDTLTGAWGAMERINATPLPYVYVVHLRTFLFIYLFLWHVVSIVDNRWKAIPPLFAASWALLGIEASAVECERPFEWHSNHLALGKMCIVISNNVAHTLQNVCQFSKDYDPDYIYHSNYDNLMKE